MKTLGYQIKAVLFDFDGTLTQPGALDFGAIRMALGCPQGVPILEFIKSLETDKSRQSALARLDQFELQGARDSVPNAGAQEVVAWLRHHGIAVGIITRNSRPSVIRALENFDSTGADSFDLMITRDDPPAPKPSGDGIIWAADRLGLSAREMLVVGDFIFDTQAGQAAGALTALLDSGGDARLQAACCDFRISSLDQIRNIVRAGMPLSAGKLPNDLLQAYLQEFKFEDPTVLIHPGVGEDVAAVDVGYDDVLVLKSDPITFTSEAIGQLAVLVNANDIATSGAVPRWFLTTLLMPWGVTPSMVRQVMHELAQTCSRWGITLCGGHTEITTAVQRPVVAGMMVGSVRRNALVDKKNMAEGDLVMLTKGVAVEGTAIIARDFGPQLRSKGVGEREISESGGFLEQISILPEARLAADKGLASAMHDVTEGGLATALEELSAAGGHKIAVQMEMIPIFKQTRKICAALDLDPLGLIGSGSLLICCPAAKRRQLMDQLNAQGIAVTAIGRVLGQGRGVLALQYGKPAPWPHFEADEITKLFP